MAERRKRRPRSAETEAPKTTEQAVNYIPPAPINRKQVILVLASIVAVAVCIFLGLAVFFKVDKNEFQVHGNRLYRADTIWDASGIKNGDSLLTFGKAKAASRIMQQLPYVKSVRIQITLPNTVSIYIEELNVYMAVQDSNDDWWFLSPEGKVLEKTEQSEAIKRTMIEGLRIKPPKVGDKAVAQELPAGEEDNTAPTVVTYTNAERLQAALEIATCLEKNEILNAVASINVEDMSQIVLWYGQRFQVKFGDSGNISDKIPMIKQVIHEQLGAKDTGILYVIFKNDTLTLEFEYANFE